MKAQPESTPPLETKHSLNWGSVLGWAFSILLLYILSFGPVWRLANRGHLLSSQAFFGAFYKPLIWAYIQTPLQKPLGMYLHLWNPDDFDKNGEPLLQQ